MQRYLRPLCHGSIMGGLLTLGLTCAMLGNSTAAAASAAAEQHWVLRVNGQIVAAADEEKELAEMVDAVKASYCDSNTDSCEVLSHLESEQISGTLDATVPTGAEAEQAVAAALRVRTSSTVVEQQVIEAQTVTVEDDTMYTDQTVTEEGWDGELEITTEISAINGETVVAKQVSSVVTTAAQDTVVRVGTKSRPEFIWPAHGNYTGNYGIDTINGANRKHDGVDIDSAGGTNIVAARGGTVVYAGWDNGGYGNLIVIQHDNGTHTYYAHNSAIYVSVGQTVEQGQSIAQMGATGKVTGVHCHFEIRLGTFSGLYVASTTNPLNYLSLSDL
jgi:murein DD-endopeptidase MepM/ murein hydrolase activator NlpD